MLSAPGPTGAATGRSSIASRVTAEIVQALKRGVKPWIAPWSTAAALALPLRYNGIAYHGGNILILWAVAQARGYTSRTWMTFQQARELGGVVRRGERATFITFYSNGKPRDPDTESASETEAAAGRSRAVMRSYAVFSVNQIEGLPADFYSPPVPRADCDETQLGALFARAPAKIEHGGARAFYNPRSDTIHLPPRNSFVSTAQYFATRLHELAHWSGHPTRLARDLQPRTSTVAYAREELTAELTAAFLGAELGLPVDHIENHAAYLHDWLKLLEHEPGALLSAAAKAQAAADYLRSFLCLPETAELQGAQSTR